MKDYIIYCGNRNITGK